jgi:hypothetical protein
MDLRRSAARLSELTNFIVSREGFFPHFYCDQNRHLVHIGFGTLVSEEADARRIARENAVHFRFAAPPTPMRRPSVDEIVADWRRVHDQPGLTEDRYSGVAQLRIDDRLGRHLMTQEISHGADALYHTHPFMVSFDERVAMAFVDTRYNPAGLNPYQSQNGDIRRLWAALDPRSPQYDLNTAVTLFERLWANRGGHLSARYSMRHFQRVQWLRQGLEAMGATRGGMQCR